MASIVPRGIATLGSYKDMSMEAIKKKIYMHAYVCERDFMWCKQYKWVHKLCTNESIDDWNSQICLQVSRDIGSCKNARGRGKENGEHAKKTASWSTPAGHKVFCKNIRW